MQSAALKRKVRFFLLCEEETRLCAFSAGVICETERLAEGESAITVDQFKRAKAAVRAMQARRLGSAPVGIAC